MFDIDAELEAAQRGERLEIEKPGDPETKLVLYYRPSAFGAGNTEFYKHFADAYARERRRQLRAALAEMTAEQRNETEQDKDRSQRLWEKIEVSPAAATAIRRRLTPEHVITGWEDAEGSITYARPTAEKMVSIDWIWAALERVAFRSTAQSALDAKLASIAAQLEGRVREGNSSAPSGGATGGREASPPSGATGTDSTASETSGESASESEEPQSGSSTPSTSGTSERSRATTRGGSGRKSTRKRGSSSATSTSSSPSDR